LVTAHEFGQNDRAKKAVAGGLGYGTHKLIEKSWPYGAAAEKAGDVLAAAVGPTWPEQAKRRRGGWSMRSDVRSGPGIMIRARIVKTSFSSREEKLSRAIPPSAD
jgi:hypothetical protein